MNNKKSRKPSLFAETDGSNQKKVGVLAGIETGVQHNSSNINKMVMLLVIIPIIVWLVYLAIQKTTSGSGPNSNPSQTILAANTEQSSQSGKPNQTSQPTADLSPSSASTEPETTGNAVIIDVPTDGSSTPENEDAISTAFDALEKQPATKQPTTAVKPKSTTKVASKSKTKHKTVSRKKAPQQQTSQSKADSGDIAVLQALLVNKKVPSKPDPTPELFGKITEQPLSTNEVEAMSAAPNPPADNPATAALGPKASPPQQALLSNGLDNQQLAATAGNNKEATLLSSTKNLIKKCEEMDELDAAICKWDVCDQYGGDESICSKEFLAKKESGFKLLEILGLD